MPGRSRPICSQRARALLAAVQLGAAAPATHPDEPEVADGRTDRCAVGLEVIDLESRLVQVPRVPRAEDPPSYDHGPLHGWSIASSSLDFYLIWVMLQRFQVGVSPQVTPTIYFLLLLTFSSLI